MSLFLLVRPVLAQTIEISKNISVGTEVFEGYTQVYFKDAGEKRFITSGNVNSKSPISVANLVVYVTEVGGEGQIFLYDIASDVKTQLTFIGTNLNPRVDVKGRVVWEGWDGNTWQIFFFDGKSTTQLTTGDTSLNPDFYQDYISYGRRDITGTWRAVVYSIRDGKSLDVITGEKAKNPQIRNGDIYLGAGGVNEEKFPLNVNDIFLLDLVSSSESTGSADIKSIDTIIDELSATPSGVPEIPIATESGSGL